MDSYLQPKSRDVQSSVGGQVKTKYFSNLVLKKVKKLTRGNQVLLLLFAMLGLLFLLNVALGSVNIPLSQILESLSGQSEQNVWNDIIWQFRFPKAITCVVAGASLATGGLLM
ncbi:MAG: iron chelate uptake ABC transporter family permease subunit, partial [Bacteroidia bacterium]|nr:iron chelate uptake ABC transporter family permease subunit [Bacteroidia bacterium]